MQAFSHGVGPIAARAAPAPGGWGGGEGLCMEGAGRSDWVMRQWPRGLSRDGWLVTGARWKTFSFKVRVCCLARNRGRK